MSPLRRVQPGCRLAFRLLLGLAGLTAFVGPAVEAQQQGAIVGTITDAETLQPVSGAQVFIPGTVIGTLTNDAGTYRLENVPAGPVTVEVRLIGYKDASQTVTVQAGQVATADFQIEQTALKLQDIVVTGVVAATPRVKLPFTVERIDNEDMPVVASDVSSLLTGKAAGVLVMSGNGQPGEQSEILLRGPTSINATGRTQAPLIVIDGVIQGDNATLADVNALDIDHVEIVKGAAAASLYGSRAQNGVIQISTKRGQNLPINTFDVTIRGEFGFSDLATGIDRNRNHPYLLNENGTKFIDSSGNEVDYVHLGGTAAAVLAPPPWDPGGVGTPETSFSTGEYPGSLFDQIDRFFNPGDTYSLYAAATGRFGESSFRASFESFREKGVVECTDCATEIGDEGYKRYNARLNLDSRLGSQFEIAASGFYSNSTQDNAAISTGAFGALGATTSAANLVDTGCLDITTPDGECVTATGEPGEIDPAYQDYFNGLPRVDAEPMAFTENPLYLVAITEDTNWRTRTMGSLDVSWTPITWFSVEGNASYDRTDLTNTRMLPKDQVVRRVGESPGGRLYQNGFYSQALNASITAGFNYGFMDGDLATRIKARYVYEDQEYSRFDASGQVFTVPGVPSFGNISGTKNATNTITDIRAEGYFLIGSADYRGRYIADGLVRRDGSSLFGPEERWHTYYRLSGAWRVAQEDFWGAGWWDEFKLRYSYGTAGGRPNFWAQYETYSVEGGNVVPANLGNTKLKPERTTEQEAGINLVFLQSIGLDVSYAWARMEDQLDQYPLPGFVGFSSQWQNVGTIKSNTWEASLRYSAIDRPDLGLSFRLTWDRARNEITHLDVPPYTVQRVFRVAEGEELGSLWDERLATTCADVASSQGLLRADAGDFCEVYGSQFQVNDEGYMVWVGDGNSWKDGISRHLWGTSGEVAGSSYSWGMPIRAREQNRTCLRDHPEDEGVGELCPLSTFVPLASTNPSWNGAFFTNLRWRGLALNVLLDASVGHDIANNSRLSSHLWVGGLAELDQADKPDENKKPICYHRDLYGNGHFNQHFIENGSWLKVREISLGYSLPQSFLESVFKGAVDRLTINLIGRNLLTFTEFTGYDPEIGGWGDDVGHFGTSTIGRVQAGQYPNFRTITASLEVVF